ncbi:MAG TPA: MFS transporter, partial [Candidatus Omnitrophota bacterium]|nr:MFS transporter [Candidatus Omnitrophota bacterium]
MNKMNQMVKSVFGNIFHALKHRNFRLFFTGQSVSLIGTWMQYVAMSWLVYRLTGSAFMLGVVNFAAQLPFLILGPFAGILVDRVNRHKLLIVVQTISMLQAFTLAILALSGVITVKQIIVLGFILGTVNSFEIPARHAFVLNMVGNNKNDLGNAIALNSFIFNLARFVGPLIAGLFIGWFGEGACFLMNSVSFFAVISSLLLMRIKTVKSEKKKDSVFRDMTEGFKYTFGSVPIRQILMLVSVISLMASAYMVVLPVIAKNVLHGGPATLGLLMAGLGIGCFLATIFLAANRNKSILADLLPGSALIFSVSVIIGAFCTTLWFAIPLLAVAGFGIMVNMAGSNIILQTIVDDDKRGRV